MCATEQGPAPEAARGGEAEGRGAAAAAAGRGGKTSQGTESTRGPFFVFCFRKHFFFVFETVLKQWKKENVPFSICFLLFVSKCQGLKAQAVLFCRLFLKKCFFVFEKQKFSQVPTK